MGSAPAAVSLRLPIYTVWGANTGVGKTLLSAGLAAAATHRAQKLLCYIKPVQTGFPADSDAQQVALASGTQLHCGPHASQLLPSPSPSITSIASPPTPRGIASLLYAWKQAVSPHLAVEREGRAVSDADVVSAVSRQLRDFEREYGGLSERRPLFALVETAGGVTSPGPSGQLQCDILRPLRLPALLIGDPRLGGISATISAYESLLLRGYDVDAVVMAHDDKGLDNWSMLQKHFGGIGGSHRKQRPLRVFGVPACPPPPAGWEPSQGVDLHFQQWMSHAGSGLQTILEHLDHTHQQRLNRLRTAADRGQEKLWWPFTQHAIQNKSTVQVVDARAGEHWLVYRGANAAATDDATLQEADAPTSSGTGEREELVALYDAACSWWTQGMPGHLQIELTRAMAHAAGRYMHVIFPQVVHDPALSVSESLLSQLGTTWASRVFFSDNGSTAIEVALKMAFRKYIVDHGLTELDGDSNGHAVELQVLGLQGGYHGDTLGAMDCVPPSPYNGWLQFPWYKGRGLFLEPPYVAHKGGMYRVQMPGWMRGQGAESRDLEGLLDAGRDSSALAATYEHHIEQALQDYVTAASSGGVEKRLAACIMEPLLQGAAGMQMIDPLFQRILAKVCRRHQIPVILDEVFTGLWRVGHVTGGQAIGVQPDIAAFAKLLTGGSIPMSVTVASEAVFKAFEGSSKLVALLHGHSYTAHPIGCAASVAALALLSDPRSNPNICTPESHADSHTCPKTPPCAAACGRLVPLWAEAEVVALSCLPQVARAQALGTVLTVEVQPLEGEAGGYSSNATAAIAKKLYDGGVYIRPLGNVLYLMVTPFTTPDTCLALMQKLKAALTQ